MSRHIKLVAEKGTDVTDDKWTEFVNFIFANFTDCVINGGVISEYIAFETHIGDISWFAKKFKQFEGSNIAFALYDLDREPDETFTL